MSRTLPGPFPVHSIEANDLDDAPEFLIGPVRTCGPREKATRPHRHEFTEILCVTGGSGTHFIDGEAYPIEAGRVYIVRRGQVHHWSTEEPLDGTLVLFRESFLAGEGGPRALDFGEGPAMLCPDLAQIMRFEAVLGGMAEESGLRDGQSYTILRHLLSVLILQCERIEGHRVPRRVEGGPSSSLNRDFARLVSDRASATLTVGECALALGVTPGYLHEVVVARTGRTPGQVIRRAVLAESQRLLARTELTCAQVADRLGFDDASYFSRFFRRESGVTPSVYRRRTREMPGARNREKYQSNRNA